MSKTPIAERRKELKTQLWAVSQTIKAKQEEIEVRKLELYRDTDFKALGATNADAVKMHHKLLCHDDAELKSHEADLSYLEGQKNEIEQELSDINFRQRERTNVAASEVAKQMEKLMVALDKLTEASHTFSEGADRVERSVNALTGRRAA